VDIVFLVGIGKHCINMILTHLFFFHNFYPFFFLSHNVGGDEAVCLQSGESYEGGKAVFLARWTYNFVTG
jgi:hypothetical protein